jgi:hypothetical protein
MLQNDHQTKLSILPSQALGTVIVSATAAASAAFNAAAFASLSLVGTDSTAGDQIRTSESVPAVM